MYTGSLSSSKPVYYSCIYIYLDCNHHNTIPFHWKNVHSQNDHPVIRGKNRFPTAACQAFPASWRTAEEAPTSIKIFLILCIISRLCSFCLLQLLYSKVSIDENASPTPPTRIYSPSLPSHRLPPRHHLPLQHHQRRCHPDPTSPRAGIRQRPCPATKPPQSP
jgi:hypothetical protein